MVKKDFNHPSVVMYSVGNEIPEIGTDHGAKICHDISEKIKELDNTRYTLAAINGVFAAGEAVPQIMADIMAGLESSDGTDGNVNDFMAVMDANMDKIVVHDEITKRLDKACVGTDIAGYNYMTARYELDGKNRPNRVIVGREISLTCMTDGEADIWFGSGNPKPKHDYLDKVTQTWNGKALLIIRKRTKHQVKVVISAESQKVEVSV